MQPQEKEGKADGRESSGWASLGCSSTLIPITPVLQRLRQAWPHREANQLQQEPLGSVSTNSRLECKKTYILTLILKGLLRSFGGFV